MRIRKYIIQIFVACLLTACAPSNDELLSSLLYFDGCTSPCWVGIEVGKTSRDQTQKILVDRYTNQKLHLSTIFLWDINEVDSSYGTISFSKGVVDRVHLYFKEPKFTAKDTIAVLGEPTDVMISVDLTKSSGQCLGTQLAYSTTGVLVWLDMTQVHKGVERSQLVKGFWFESPEELRNMQIKVQNDGTSIVVEWQGYKDYCKVISR